MIGSDLVNENGNDISGDIFEGIVDLLDTPMEDVREDIAGGDLDAELQSPPDDLASFSSIFSGDVCSGSPTLSTNVSVSYEETSWLKWLPNITEETSSGSISLHNNSSNNKELHVFQTSTSCASKRSHPLVAIEQFYNSGDSLEIHVPEKILNSVKRKKKKRKIKKLSVLLGSIEMKTSSLQKAVPSRKCMHCGITRSSEWRKGPMGLQTLCNACGHRYRSGCLFPEYRPIASPTFVPSLHSNRLKKVSEMRYRAGLEGAITASPTFVAPLHSNSRKHPVAIRKCMHCEVRRTPQWREGPMGPNTLCNACGLLYSRWHLFPEYRPAASPTFVPSLHSNYPQKIIETRKKAGMEAGMVVESPIFIASSNSNSCKKFVAMRNNAGRVAAVAAGPTSITSLHSNSHKKVVATSNKAGQKAATAASPTSVASLQSNAHKKVVEMSDKAGEEAAMVASPIIVASSNSNSCRNVLEMRNKAGQVAAVAASPTSIAYLHSNSHKKVVELSNKAGQVAAVATSPTSIASLHSNSSKKVVVMSNKAGQVGAVAASPTSVASLHSNAHKKVVETSDKASQEAAMVASPTSIDSLHSNSHKKYSLQQPVAIRKCMHCEVRKTSLWRNGPMGPKTLCNACGIRYRSGRLFPDYRPVANPTFVVEKVIEMKKQAGKESDMAAADTVIAPLAKFQSYK